MHAAPLTRTPPTHQRTDTQAAAEISEELQRIQGVESHLVKEDQTAGNENHWPSLVTEFTICAWNQLEEERKQKKLAGEGNVWASINRRPTVWNDSERHAVIYYSAHIAPCLSHRMKSKKLQNLTCLVRSLDLFSDNGGFKTRDCRCVFMTEQRRAKSVR